MTEANPTHFDPSHTAFIETISLTKKFPMVLALDQVNFEVKKGEIHCLLGENGAGKTTLAECLYGYYRPSSGLIKWKGKAVEIPSPSVAMRLGIGMVHQHFMLVEPHTVLENIILGLDTPGIMLDTRSTRKRILELCEIYNVSLNLDAYVWQLSVGEQQWVEILKALYEGAELLILDEPTAVLTPQESERLFGVLKQMSLSGLSIIFITHKLNEVIAVSDRVTVLRKGRVINTVNTAEVTKADLAKMMVGREVVFRVSREEVQAGEVLLEVEDLRACNDLGLECIHGLNLKLHAREILGIAGVAGNGQKELFETLIGVRKPSSGHIRLLKEEITHQSAGMIYDKGMAHIPSNRIKEGLILDFTVAENLILGREWKLPFSSRFQLNKRAIRDFAQRNIKDFDIVTPAVDHPTGKLSGGNLQKVILAREIGSQPHVLIANQPCRGLDVGVIEYVHTQLLKLREEGVGILLFSEDLDEILTLSDRIAVIYQGEIVGLFRTKDVHLETIGLLMAGGKD